MARHAIHGTRTQRSASDRRKPASASARNGPDTASSRAVDERRRWSRDKRPETPRSSAQPMDRALTNVLSDVNQQLFGPQEGRLISGTFGPCIGLLAAKGRIADHGEYASEGACVRCVVSDRPHHLHRGGGLAWTAFIAPEPHGDGARAAANRRVERAFQRAVGIAEVVGRTENRRGCPASCKLQGIVVEWQPS